MNASIGSYITRTGTGTATLSARYACGEGVHLWVSAKQAAGGRDDARLAQEGSSQISAAWLQSHPQNFTCDGATRNQSFGINTLEQGFGSLVRGVAYVQFCLVSDEGELLISETRWVAVMKFCESASMADVIGTAAGMVDTVLAPAKLTLSLRVVGVREDGYHLLDSEMVSLHLADELEFSEGDGLEVVGNGAVPVGEDNLVCRALRVTGRTARVRLHKHIPVGGGLGGGSADAAAVLRWAGISDLSLAASLGADVPFCLVGGRARVSGIGEIVEPLPFEHREFTLLTPPFGVPTPAVYRAWDDLGGRRAEGPNDLEPAAVAVEPRLVEWRDRLGDLTGAMPVLAGSGATWFVEGTFDGPGLVHASTRPPAS